MEFLVAIKLFFQTGDNVVLGGDLCFVLLLVLFQVGQFRLQVPYLENEVREVFGPDRVLFADFTENLFSGY